MKSAGILLWVMSAAAALAAGPDLIGHVTGNDGQPLGGATVFIYSAAPKHGTSTLCPYCYADCAKKSKTDGHGRFEITSLDPTLIFRLLAVAPGRESGFVAKVDPAAGEVRIALKPLSAQAVNSPLRIKGVVIDEHGQPLAGAVIGPEGVDTGSGTQWGGTDEFVDPLAVSDDHGRFTLFCKSRVGAVHALADGRGVAQKWVELKPGGDYLIRMADGVAVTGRIVRDAKPLPGVSVGLTTTDRICGEYFDCAPIGTDADGHFVLTCVPPGREFALFGGMDSMERRGVVPMKIFTTGASGATLDLGEIHVVPGHLVQGRIVLTDGREIPPGTRLLLSRERVKDSTAVALGGDGSFRFFEVPAESVGLSVRLAGYKFSKRNPSLDWLSGSIVGRVPGNIAELLLLMEPGQWQFNNAPKGGDGPADGDVQPSEKPLRSAPGAGSDHLGL